MSFRSSRLPYQTIFKEFDEGPLGKIMETDKFTWVHEALDHTIFCVAIALQRPEGTLDAD